MKPSLLVLFLLVAAFTTRGATAGSSPPPHWAFQPIQNPPVPSVSLANEGWPMNEIDRFILARLESEGAPPAPRADRRTLLRRASFGLTGLPPSAAEIDAFVADTSPDAWNKVVNRLLDSPHYGEHWARHWLDVVRYADTAGETADYPVPVAWRYRNYVIDAFNTDKPYDEFLREQIAGDVLARMGPRERYAERVTATGFLALSRRFGFDSENYHHLTLQDTLDTLGQSVLGLTLGCARCHDHKYDPVSMPEYYALYGIFESTRYAFPGSEQKQRHRALVPLIPPGESHLQWLAFESRLADLAGRLERQKKPVPDAVLRSLDELDGDFEMQAPAAGGSKGVLVPPWIYEGPISVTQDAQSPFKNLHPRGRVGASVASGSQSYRVAQSLPPSRSSRPARALHVNLDFLVASNAPPQHGAHRFWLGRSPSHPAVEILITAETVSLRSDDRVETLASLRPQTWHNLQLTIDPSSRTVTGTVGVPGEVVRFDDKPLPPAWTGAIEYMALEGKASDHRPLPGIAFDNFGVQDAPIASIAADPLPSTTPAASTEPAPDETEAIRREWDALLAEGPFELAYAVSEGTPREARIQWRGDPERLGAEVPRGFLKALGGGPLPSETRGSGRLELAEWLTAPSHPLTARVMVNRLWQYHFGQGLVKTPNDFGTRGLPPTHPELLDYLATRFIQANGSIKTIHRLLLTSATYQQRSAFTVVPSATNPQDAIDPCPALPSTDARPFPSGHGDAFSALDRLSPFPRRRLAAEEIRDALLQVSGRLDASPGRGHPFPPPTGWGFTQHGPFRAVYDHSRRSIYLMTQRLQRHPFLALFDGPDPNASTAERRTSTVPTQALFFLNDPFVHACAEAFAARMLEDGGQGENGTETAQIEAAYRLALGRSATAVEQAEAAAFLDAYRKELSREGTLAPDDASLPHAARAAFARVLFGSNEFLTID